MGTTPSHGIPDPGVHPQKVSRKSERPLSPVGTTPSHGIPDPGVHPQAAPRKSDKPYPHRHGGAQIAGHGVSCTGSPNQVPQSQSEDDQRNRYGASPALHPEIRKMWIMTALSCFDKCTSRHWHTKEWHHRQSRTAQDRSLNTPLTPRRQARVPMPTDARPSGTPRHTNTGQRP